MSERFKGRSQADIARLVRTEGTYVANQAMLAPFLESGLYDRYRYVATMDSHTSDVCRSMDGQEFELEKQQPGVNFPPMHPNCRSTFEIVMPEEGDDGYDDFLDDYIDQYIEKYGDEAKALENGGDTPYNNTNREKYAGKQTLSFVNKETIQKIEENTNWTTGFKEKLMQRVRYFDRHGIDADIHFVPKVDRLNKKGYIEITDDDIINTFKQPVKYIDPNGAKIHFSEELQLAVLEDENSGKLFGTIRRKDISDRWKEV